MGLKFISIFVCIIQSILYSVRYFLVSISQNLFNDSIDRPVIHYLTFHSSSGFRSEAFGSIVDCYFQLSTELWTRYESILPVAIFILWKWSINFLNDIIMAVKRRNLILLDMSNRFDLDYFYDDYHNLTLIKLLII